MSAFGLYEDLWARKRDLIFKIVEQKRTLDFPMEMESFEAVGDRKKYAFRLDLQNGAVANNIGGSAVARDLARVLDRHPDYSKVFGDKQVTIRLDSNFVLHIISY